MQIGNQAYQPFDAERQWHVLSEFLDVEERSLDAVTEAWAAVDAQALSSFAQRFRLQADLTVEDKHKEISKYAKKRLEKVHENHQTAPDLDERLPMASLPPPLQLLCTSAYLNAPKEIEGTRLHSMIRKVTPEEEFNLLLTMDIDLEAVDQDGNTALHLAVIRGQEHTAQALLQSGANVNAQNAEGKTALMIAIESFSAPLVQLILKQDGVELELTDALGDTALNVCARTCPRGKGYLSVDLNVTFQHYFVRELAAKGAEINTQNAQGDTPLHQCGRRKYGKTALYAILKQLGADDTIRNNEGKRPFCRWYYDPLWNMYGLLLLPIPYFATAHAANALGKGKWWV